MDITRHISDPDLGRDDERFASAQREIAVKCQFIGQRAAHLNATARITFHSTDRSA